MKPWQKGIELDTLLEWTDKFEEYNKYCFSPFTKAKKNGIASAIDKDNLYQTGNIVYEMRTAKTASKIKMFRAGPEIAEIHKGERVITKLSILEKNITLYQYHNFLTFQFQLCKMQNQQYHPSPS